MKTVFKRRCAITRTYKFCAAHSLPGLGKCERWHGHNYTVEVAVTADSLSPQGVFIPFDALDRAIAVIFDALDHRVLLPGKETSTTTARALMDDESTHTLFGLTCSSTEALAMWLFDQVQNEVYEYGAENPETCGENLRLLCLKLHETDRNSAEVWDEQHND